MPPADAVAAPMRFPAAAATHGGPWRSRSYGLRLGSLEGPKNMGRGGGSKTGNTRPSRPAANQIVLPAISDLSAGIIFFWISPLGDFQFQHCAPRIPRAICRTVRQTRETSCHASRKSR
jgi:hypothetical protein